MEEKVEENLRVGADRFNVIFWAVSDYNMAANDFGICMAVSGVSLLGVPK